MASRRVVVGTLLLVVLVLAGVAVALALWHHDSAPTPSPSPAPQQAPAGPAVPTPPPAILSATVEWGGTGACTSDAGCNPGRTCIFGVPPNIQNGKPVGVCSGTQECSRCKPVASTGLDDPDCLDYWQTTANSQRLLDTVGHDFATPISSHACEYRHPKFRMSYYDTATGERDTCSLSFSNQCESNFAPSAPEA